ncbi:hypothetical protein ACLG6S_16000 [Thermodesulfobacteriota bacterium B35]
MELFIDPELKYCPQCHDEYRADIVTCAECGVELLTGVEMQALQEERHRRKAGRPRQIGPDEELVAVRRGPVLQIKELQVILGEHDIPSLAVKEGGAGCGKGCCGTDLILRVRADDASEVMRILAEEHVRGTALTEHDTSHLNAVFNTAAQEATCPACGCRFPTTTTTCPECGLCFA